MNTAYLLAIVFLIIFVVAFAVHQSGKREDEKAYVSLIIEVLALINTIVSVFFGVTSDPNFNFSIDLSRENVDNVVNIENIEEVNKIDEVNINYSNIDSEEANSIIEDNN